MSIYATSDGSEVARGRPVVEGNVVLHLLVEKGPELDVARELPGHTIFVKQDAIDLGALHVRKELDGVLVRGVEISVIPIDIVLALLLDEVIHGRTNLHPTHVLAGFDGSRIGGRNVFQPNPEGAQNVIALEGCPGMDP